MKTRIILTLAALSLNAPYLFAQTDYLSHAELSGPPVQNFTDSPFRYFAISPFHRVDVSLSPSNIRTNILNVSPREKSPWLGALFSGLLPGAGEFYGKSYLKAAIFFGVEVLAWGSFAYFRVKGDNQTDDFEKYANQNWDVRRYARWLKDEWNASLDPDEPDLEVLRQRINEFESTKFSHTLPEYYSQQYYEVIGKYQNFVAGWTDAENESGWLVTKNNFQTKHTEMFDFYAGERQRANDFYNYATTGAIVVIANHILSAADGAWTVAMYNKKIKVETGFDIKRYRSPYTGEVGNLPSFNLKVTF